MKPGEMKSKQENLMYSSKFDGDILKYKARRLGKPIFWLFGLNRRVELPVNIVLRYRKRQRLIVFTLLGLTIDSYKFGQNAPNPIRLTPMLFFGRQKKFVDPMCEVMDKCVLQTSRGRNMGLLHLNKEEFKLFHSQGEKEKLTQNEQHNGNHILIQRLCHGKLMHETGKRAISL